MVTTQREILGDIRYRLTTALKLAYPESYGARGFMQTTEPYFIKTMFNVDLRGLRADYYVGPGDGGGPIMVEIGAPEDNKWEEVISTDGKPVRVLWAGLDGMMSLTHPRATRFEEDLMTTLQPVAG